MPWERHRAGLDPEANKPTLVQTPEELLATERAPRTVPARALDGALLELEDELEGASNGSAIAGELDPVDDDAWTPNPRSNEPSHIGQVLDNRYVVEALIARGGMGIVYRCRHKFIDRRFAVKIIRSTMAHLPDAPRRFLMEAKAASAIGNEHIVDVVDYGTLADGSAYLVMELLEGVPLSDVIAKHETLPIARIANIAAQVCEGLRAAHEAGIVHRDLKPENIFLTNRRMADFVKILDFGIAKMALSGEPLTQKGLIVGTPHYMSPEQAAGAAVDARGDIYSLGVILYELATGRVPFDAGHYMAVLAKHMTEPPPPFDTLSLPAQLPREFEAIVQRCLAKRPEQRYQTMTDVRVELERMSLGLRSPSRPCIEPTLPLAPLAPLAPFEELARNTGHSLPPAPGRSLLTQPKRRSYALLLSAALLAGLTGISLWRMQAPLELPRAGGPRAAGARAAWPVRGGEARPSLDTLQSPLATATASLASTRGPAIGPAPEAPASGGSAAEPTPQATSAAPGGAKDDTAPLTTPEPLTVVELAPGKSVEIEARTRLGSRLTDEARAAAATRAQRASGRKATKGVRKGRAGKAGTAKSGKAQRARATRASSELMNPWPAPVIGPSKE